MMRRSGWQIVLAAALVVLLAVLGTLQYRWLGEVSDAERDRLRAGLRTRASELAEDFNREISRAYSAFHVDNDAFERDPGGILADAYAQARSNSIVGGLLAAVYVVDAHAEHGGRLQQLDPAARRLRPVEWPPALGKWQHAVDRFPPISSGALSPLFMTDAVDAEIPALVVPLPVVTRVDRNARVAALPDPAGPTRAVILLLDKDRVRHQLLSALVTRHFGPAEQSEYFVNVVSRLDPSQVIFASAAPDDVNGQNADVAMGMFALRLDELSLFSLHVPPPSGPVEKKNAVAITIVRRGSESEGSRVLMTRGGSGGAWELLIRCKSGSLEALVAQSRRRNLAIGLGVLGLLAVSFVFVIGSAQRQQKLARQQMEFVAAVSHELRTPLAVIRSAGENLADGVVADREQVRRYGSLIQSEGRRLTDMVERVLEYAGVNSGAALRASSDVDLHRVVEDAVSAVAAEAQEREIAINFPTHGRLPIVRGDAAALRSAVQNILGNAVKYSKSGSSVDLYTASDQSGVRISVVDRGLGIDPADLPHVFKPFFRGRRAVDAQIRGTGVGLSVVRRVIDAHGGSVRVENRAEGGTIVTLVLPLPPGPAALVGEARTAT